MDPTAPKDNPSSKDSRGSVPQAPQNPIQPGQFVVAESPHTASDSLPPLPQTSPDPNLGVSQSQAPAPPPPMPPQAPPPAPPSFAPGTPSQPDPAPFNPTANITTPPTQGSSKLPKIKMIFIILAVLILVGIVAALAWFFVLNKKPQESAKTENTPQAVDELPPAPKRTTGGFGEIPQATTEATPGSGIITP